MSLCLLACGFIDWMGCSVATCNPKTHEGSGDGIFVFHATHKVTKGYLVATQSFTKISVGCTLSLTINQFKLPDSMYTFFIFQAKLLII